MVDTENLHGSVNGSQSIAGGGLQAKGDNAYLHIKFSANEPTCDSDLTDDFSDWIGLYTDNSAEDSTDFTTYKWYKIKGDKGNTGDTGPRGISISSIEKISTSGLIDTYRINFSDSSYFDFQINNGEQNVIEKVYVNENEISVVNKAINIPIPTEEFIKSKGCIVSPTEPTTGEKVWFKKTNTGKDIFFKNENEVYEKFFEHVKLYEGNIYEQDSVTLDAPVSDFRFLLCRIKSTSSYVVVPVVPDNTNLRGTSSEPGQLFKIYSIAATYNVSNNTLKLIYATGLQISNGRADILQSQSISEIWGCY